MSVENRVFCVPVKGSPWNWIPVHGVKKTRMIVLPGGTRSLKISSPMWIQFTNVTDRLRDRLTDIGWQLQRPLLRIASRGKMISSFLNIFNQLQTFIENRKLATYTRIVWHNGQLLHSDQTKWQEPGPSIPSHCVRHLRGVYFLHEYWRAVCLRYAILFFLNVLCRNDDDCRCGDGGRCTAADCLRHLCHCHCRLQVFQVAYYLTHMHIRVKMLVFQPSWFIL